jgi:hypothetical protein
MKIEPHAALIMVAPAEARAVTTRAGLRRGHRKAGIEIELLAERSLFRRVWVVLGKRDGRRPAVLRLHSIDAGSRFLAEIDLAHFADERRTEADAGKAEDAETDRRDGRSKQNRSTESRARHASSPIGV